MDFSAAFPVDAGCVRCNGAVDEDNIGTEWNSCENNTIVIAVG